MRLSISVGTVPNYVTNYQCKVPKLNLLKYFSPFNHIERNNCTKLILAKIVPPPEGRYTFYYFQSIVVVDNGTYLTVPQKFISVSFDKRPSKMKNKDKVTGTVASVFGKMPCRNRTAIMASYRQQQVWFEIGKDKRNLQKKLNADVLSCKFMYGNLFLFFKLVPVGTDMYGYRSAKMS